MNPAHAAHDDAATSWFINANTANGTHNTRIATTASTVRRTQLAQVLANLIRNALTFVPADVTPQVLVWAEPDGGAWRFTVADNGIGIPPRTPATSVRHVQDPRNAVTTAGGMSPPAGPSISRC